MLGWSYFETQRFAESATAMRRAIQLAPGNSEYHSMLGEALVMASKDEAISQDARAAFRKAVELDPKDARARYFLAAAKDIDGKHAEAIEDWFELLAETPADAPYAKDIRDVIRNVRLACRSDNSSNARYCSGVTTPPGKRPRTMKIYFFPDLRASRSSC